MFERYTEKARRAIFFARYEASQYGSPCIETEHLLLGLLREDRELARRFLGSSGVETDIRRQIEAQITPRERISVSVEVPLTQDCKKILYLAGEEAERLGHRSIETHHLLLAMTVIEASLAGRLLREMGLRPEAIREQLAKTGSAQRELSVGVGGAHAVITELATTDPTIAAQTTLYSFLAGIKWYKWDVLSPFFTEDTRFVDAAGKYWKGCEEIEEQFVLLFASYAKRDVTFLVEGMEAGFAFPKSHEPGSRIQAVLARVLWENVSMPGEAARAMHRMTVILVPEAQDWKILFIQVTPILTR